VSGGFRHQNAAVASGACDDPCHATIVEFPTPRDWFVGRKYQHLGRGPGVGNHNRHPSFLDGGQIRTVVRRSAHLFEISWSHVSVLIYIDGGGGQKVHCGS